MRGVVWLKGSMSTPIQDLPPKGGFEGGPVIYKRHLPSRGPPGWVWLTGMSLFIGSGFYLHSRGLRIRQEVEREKRQARFAILPLLLAEMDRDEVIRQNRSLAVEAYAMSDVPGWELGKSVYKTKVAERAVKPTFYLA